MSMGGCIEREISRLERSERGKGRVGRSEREKEEAGKIMEG